MTLDRAEFENGVVFDFLPDGVVGFVGSEPAAAASVNQSVTVHHWKPVHSCLSASIGSILAARRAGR